MGNHKESKVDLWLSEDSLFLISCWVRDGYTKKDIAAKLHISPNRVKEWEDKYPEFKKAMSKNRELVDYEVENALYRRAVGFKSKEVKVILNYDGTSKMETTVKEIVPDSTACLAWLNNRKPDEWKRNRDNFGDSNKQNNLTIKIKKADDSATISVESNDDEWEGWEDW